MSASINPRSDNFRGAQAMTLAMLFFGISDMAVKFLNQDVSLFQILFLRGFLVVLFFTVLIWRSKAPMPRTRFEWLLMVARGVVECAVAYTFFKALSKISLTDATTILQLLPMVVTLAAYFIYGEKFGLPRLLAIFAGFIGVWLVVRPSFSEVNVSYLLALSSMLLITLREMITRALPKETSNLWAAAVLAGCLIFMGVAGTFVTGEWVEMTPHQYGLLLITAVFVMVGYIGSVMAMRMGEVSFVGGFRYTGIIFAIIIDIIIFQDRPDALTLMGCALITAAGIFTISRERKSRKINP